MSKAYDCLSLNNDATHVTAVLSLKRMLRIIGDDDVVIQFSDGSSLVYKRGESWRQDRLEILNNEV